MHLAARGVAAIPLSDPPILVAAVGQVLLRDLRALRREIDAYPDDASLWQVVPGISNSAGTLILHLAGNVRHFIGAVLGETGYVRDREGEFSRTGVARTVLHADILAAIQAVEDSLPKLTAFQLDAAYPIALRGRRLRTADFLVHLVGHLDYHLGQIDYHRRILTGGGSIDVLSPGELPEQ